MKKRLFALLLVMLLVVSSFAACGSKDSLVGKWEISTLDVNGDTLDYQEYISALGIEAPEFYIDVKSDGTAEMNAMGAIQEGTWREDGGDYYMTFEGYEQEVTLSGGELSMESGGMTVTFKK